MHIYCVCKRGSSLCLANETVCGSVSCGGLTAAACSQQHSFTYHCSATADEKRGINCLHCWCGVGTFLAGVVCLWGLHICTGKLLLDATDDYTPVTYVTDLCVTESKLSVVILIALVVCTLTGTTTKI